MGPDLLIRSAPRYLNCPKATPQKASFGLPQQQGGERDCEMGIWEEQYSLIAAMVSLQFIYAIENNWSKQALLGGLPASVFVFYKQVCATLVTFPIAYFLRSSNLLVISMIFSHTVWHIL